MTSFLTPRRLLDGGPYRFTREIERLMGLLGFRDVVNVDGPGDHGGDLLGTLFGQLWVIQCKWKNHGPVDSSAVDEVSRAFEYYGAARAVVVTNTRISPDAEARAQQLSRLGRTIDFWTGTDLQNLLRATSDPDPIVLRDYQDLAVTALWADLMARRRALLILATGLGKTVVGGEVIARYFKEHPTRDVLVVAHTRELVGQLERALWRHVPKLIPTQVLTGDERPSSLGGLTCATTASALNAVLHGWKPGLVMIDETHHVGEDGQYNKLLAELQDSLQFGVTATPWRGDKYDIEQRFGSASFKLGIEDGMRRGYLANVDYKMFVDNIDWDVVREASEHQYSIKELNSRLFLTQRDEAVVQALLAAWNSTLEPKAIVFCQTIEHADQMVRHLRKLPHWGSAASIHAGLPKIERQQRLLDFRAGRIGILTAVDILNEGVDVPDVNILAFARVTHSRRIFVQQLGRGLRLRDGKESVLALDFVSDIRRVAALLNMRRQLEAEDVEVMGAVPAHQIEFSDIKVGRLLDQWILDAADLETSNDEARLQYLDPDLLPA